MNARDFLVLASMIGLLALPRVSQAQEYEVIAVTGGGSFEATVTYKGSAQKEAGIRVDKDVEVCGNEAPNEDLLLGPGGGLANAVVYLADVKKGRKPDPTPMTLANHHCRFQPHVQVGVAGGSLTITNEDPVLHNTRLFLVEQQTRRTVLNKGLPEKGMTIRDDRALRRSGEYSVKCDAHSFMSAWIITLPHPYSGVTGADGKVKITDIPPGEYGVVVWHETLGSRQEKVRIEGGKSAALGVHFAVK